MMLYVDNDNINNDNNSSDDVIHSGLILMISFMTGQMFMMRYMLIDILHQFIMIISMIIIIYVDNNNINNENNSCDDVINNALT